ncbi:MAG: 3'-5' exonuclease, partial [Myxococcota bacterium]|nr:3'-5' exonuclease [Myxococcota bacterium]
MSAADALIAETPLAVLDVETSGRSPHRDRILELSVVRLDPGAPPRLVFDSLIQSPKIGASEIHQIYARDLKDAPSFASLAPKIIEALEGTIWVAFNAYFDVRFMNAAFAQTGIEAPPPFLCAMGLRKMLGFGSRMGLKATCEAAGLPFNEGHHIAVFDTWMTALWTRILRQRMLDLRLERFGELETLGNNKFLQSLQEPLWTVDTRPTLPESALMKSRYATLLQQPPFISETSALPPISDPD